MLRCITRMVPKQGWKLIGGQRIYFRSNWEVEFARFLQFEIEHKIIAGWEFEPKTFFFEKIKSGTRKYIPDFRIDRMDGSHYWVEVKGYYDRKSITKIKRFKKYFPDEELRIIDKDWFKANKNTLKLCPIAIDSKADMEYHLSNESDITYEKLLRKTS